MKKFFWIVMLVFFLLLGCNEGENGGDNDNKNNPEPEYLIETPSTFTVSIDVEEQTFQVSVKDRDGNPQEGIFVQTEFAEFFAGELDESIRVQEVCADSEGKVSFLIPYHNEEAERDVFIHLPDFPETAEKVIIVYIQHLEYFGYAFTGIEGVGEKEDYFEETSPFSNIALIGDSSTWTVIDKILAASDYGQQSIVSIGHLFCNIVFDSNGYVTDIKLWPDYLERWRYFANEIQPYEELIIGFLGVDEPYWNAICCGISFQEMRFMIEEIAFQIKARFPDKKVIGTIFITERELAQEKIWGRPTPPPEDILWYGIPENYDWVGIYYYWSGHSDFDQFEKIWQERMQSFDEHLYPHQQIVLVPGTFSHVGLDIEQELITLASWYIDMAKRDTRMVAIIPFLWPDHENLVGLESMFALQEVWREIGEEILQ